MRPVISIFGYPPRGLQDRSSWYVSFVFYLRLTDAFVPATWSNWVLAGLASWAGYVALRTLGAIKRQAEEMKAQTALSGKAASAALLNAQALINAERGWMVAQIESETIPNLEGTRLIPFSVRCRNNGRTPAFLLEMGNHGVVLPREQPLSEERLPWDSCNIDVWPGEGMPLQPNDFVLRHNYSTVAPDGQKIHRGLDWLWVYGYIKYRDAFGNEHETRYCFLWDNVHNVSGFGEGTHFLTRGPASYIGAS